MSIRSIRLLAVASLTPLLLTSMSFAQTVRGEPACTALQQLQVPGAAPSNVKAMWVRGGYCLASAAF